MSHCAGENVEKYPSVFVLHRKAFRDRKQEFKRTKLILHQAPTLTPHTAKTGSSKVAPHGHW